MEVCDGEEEEEAPKRARRHVAGREYDVQAAEECPEPPVAHEGPPLLEKLQPLSSLKVDDIVATTKEGVVVGYEQPTWRFFPGASQRVKVIMVRGNAVWLSNLGIFKYRPTKSGT